MTESAPTKNVTDQRRALRSVQFGLVIAMSLLVVWFLLAQRKPGHNWGDDFAQYISHARNLAQGRNYAETGYIPNPEFKKVGPKTYPPFFPLVLAPLYARFGLDYAVLKIPGIVFFAASFPVIFVLFRKQASAANAFGAVLLWAAWPFILAFKENVLPDLMFVFVLALTLLALRSSWDYGQGELRFWPAVGAGLLMYACCATRSAGIVVPAAAIAADVARFKKLRPFLITALGVFAICYTAQNLSVHSESSYLRMLAPSPAENAREYLYAASTLFSSARTGGMRLVRYALTSIAILLGAAGYLRSLVRYRSVDEFFFLGYTMVVILWSAGFGERYLIPIVPIFFLYLFEGIDLISTRAPAIRKPLIAGLAVAIAFSYASEYREFWKNPPSNDVANADFVGVCGWTLANTQPGEIFIVRKPRLFALYTGRRASVYPQDGSPRAVWRYRQDIKAKYVVVSRVFENDSEILGPFVDAYGHCLVPVYSNQSFMVYASAEDCGVH